MIKKNKLFCLENNKPYKNYTKSCTFINSKHFHKSLSYYYFNLGRTCIKKKVDTYNKQLFHHFCSSEKKILIFHIMSTQTLFVLELTINTFLNTSKCVRLNSVSLPLLKKRTHIYELGFLLNMIVLVKKLWYTFLFYECYH